jgi:CRP-like cAMP-binding protein
MADRLEGDDGMRRLITASCHQRLVNGDEQAAQSLAESAQIFVAQTGFVVISQAGAGNDLYLIIDGEGRLVRGRRARPQIFIGSSSEAIPIAEAIRDNLQESDFNVVLWTQGVFEVSHVPVDDLELQLEASVEIEALRISCTQIERQLQ